MARISMAASAAVVGGCAAFASAQAQGLVTLQKLSAGLANELVGEAVAECAKKNYAVTAVVADLDGVRQAVLRGNGAPIHTLDNAFYKAYSSASLTLARKEESTKIVNRNRTRLDLAGMACAYGDRAGLNTSASIKRDGRATAHTLRDTFASWLVQHGVSACSRCKRSSATPTRE